MLKEQYKTKLMSLLQYLGITINIDTYYDGSLSFVDNLSHIVTFWVSLHEGDIDLKNIEVEGESKKVIPIPNTQLCLIKLKPTLYSYTFNRCAVVEGTDDLRYSFWSLFAKYINQAIVDYNLGLRNEVHLYKPELFSKFNAFIGGSTISDYPLLSSYLSQIVIDNTRYAISYYVPKEIQTNLEVIWKSRMVGTMKHNLFNVDKFKTAKTSPMKGEPILYEGNTPEFVRFDWRNPYEYNGERCKDECIPDDFAAFYINIDHAKNSCKLASNIIDFMLHKCGYRFIDTCYFIDQTGNTIYSEITPDGMRIQKLGDDKSRFDKDLWRQGKDRETILTVWGQLLTDLEAIY